MLGAIAFRRKISGYVSTGIWLVYCLSLLEDVVLFTKLQAEERVVGVDVWVIEIMVSKGLAV